MLGEKLSTCPACCRASLLKQSNRAEIGQRAEVVDATTRDLDILFMGLAMLTLFAARLCAPENDGVVKKR